MNRLAAFVLLLVGVCGVSATDVYQQRLIIPSYGAGYQRQGLDGGGQQEQTLLLREMLAEFRALRQDFSALRQDLAAGRGGAKADTAPDGAKVIAARCMGCHDAKTADGGLILVDKEGLLAELSVDQRYRNQRRVQAGTMPPAKDKQGRPLPPVPAAERDALLALIGPQKQEGGK